MRHRMTCHLHPEHPAMLARLLAIMLAVLLHGTSTAAAAPEPDELLSHERWREHKHGISVRMPLDTVQLATSDVPGDPLARMACAGGSTINIFIRQAQEPQSINEIKTAAFVQIGFAQPDATILDEKMLNVDGRPGVMYYFRIPEKVEKRERKKDPWVLGQAIILIDEQTVALIQLDVDAAEFDEIRPVYEAVVNSYEQVDPEQIVRERAVQIERGKAWRESLTDEQIQSAIIAEQWFRIVDDGKDIGYMRITQRKDRRLQDQGMRVDVQAHIAINNATYNTLSNYFESNDGETEAWSIRTTVRAEASRGVPSPQSASWAETGLRADDVITVNREDPQGAVKTHEWQVPAEGYMSQVDLYTLTPLLRGVKDGPVSFYAYYSNAGTLSFRTETVEPLADGGFRVRSQPSIDHPEQVSDYDAGGQLVQRKLPGGQVLLPTTRNYVARKWQVK